MADALQPLAEQKRSPWPSWADEPSRTCPTPWLVTVPWRGEPPVEVWDCESTGIFAVAQPGFLTVVAGMDGDVDGEAVQGFIRDILRQVTGKHGLGPDDVGDALWYRCVPLGRLGEAFTPFSARTLGALFGGGGSVKAEREEPDDTVGAPLAGAGGSGSRTGAGSPALAAQVGSPKHVARQPAGSPSPEPAAQPPAPEGSLPQAGAVRMKRPLSRESSLGEGGGTCGCAGNCGRKNCMQRRNKRRSRDFGGGICELTYEGGAKFCTLCRCDAGGCNKGKASRGEWGGSRWCAEHGKKALSLPKGKRMTWHGPQETPKTWSDAMHFVALYGFALRFLAPADAVIMQDAFAACLGLPPFDDAGRVWPVWSGSPGLAEIPPAEHGERGSARRKAGVVWAFIAHNIKWPQAVRAWVDYVAKKLPEDPEAIVTGLEVVAEMCDGQAWADEFSTLQGSGVSLTGLAVTCCSLGILQRGRAGGGKVVRLGGQGAEYSLQVAQPGAVAVVREWLALAPELVHPLCRATAMDYLEKLHVFAEQAREAKSGEHGLRPSQHCVRVFTLPAATLVVCGMQLLGDALLSDIAKFVPDQKEHLKPVHGLTVDQVSQLFDVPVTHVAMHACMASRISNWKAALQKDESQIWGWLIEAEAARSGASRRLGIKDLAAWAQEAMSPRRMTRLSAKPATRRRSENMPTPCALHAATRRGGAGKGRERGREVVPRPGCSELVPRPGTAARRGANSEHPAGTVPTGCSE